MANTQAMCNTFKKDLLNGIHAFGPSVVRASTAKDTFYAALYLSTATINASTTAYTSTGEVTGTGYTAGGVAVEFNTAPLVTNGVAYVTPTASIIFSNVTLSTPFDTVLIYNYTSSGKNAVSVHTFGNQIVTAGTFTLTMPVNDNVTGLLRLT